MHDTAGDAAAERPTLEPRWPLAVVLVAFTVVTILLRATAPEHETIGPKWLLPGIEVALMLALVAADPADIRQRTRWLRPLAITLIGALVVMAIVKAVTLIAHLIEGSAVTESASSLLAAGALVWSGTAVAFGLLYWELDSGGPLARYDGRREFPDLAFTQHQNPDIAPPGWRPHYVDYFVLGITTSMAFSPTDVMPMVAWTKLAMTLQSVLSLTVIGLIIARAVNVLN